MVVRKEVGEQQLKIFFVFMVPQETYIFWERTEKEDDDKGNTKKKYEEEERPKNKLYTLLRLLERSG